MRTGPHAPPLGVGPVAEVVAALAPRPCPVRDLVPVQAGRTQGVVDDRVAIGAVIVIGGGDLAARHPAGEGRAVLDDERVRRDVIHPGRQYLVEGGAHVVVGLTGCSVDQVDVDVREARIPGPPRRLPCRTGRVGAVQRGEHMRGGALHPEGDACVSR